MWSYIVSKSKSSAVIVALMLLCAYFSYFAVRGERGLLTYMSLQQKVAEAEKMSANYDRKREELEQKVNLLSSNSLDLDLLDERARAVLNVIGDDEFIIIDDDDETSEELNKKVLFAAKSQKQKTYLLLIFDGRYFISNHQYRRTEVEVGILRRYNKRTAGYCPDRRRKAPDNNLH